MFWKSKSCPRCEGDTFVDKDQYGWYRECLQCGRIIDITYNYIHVVQKVEDKVEQE